MSGKALASKPTITRFEHTPTVKELYNIAYAFSQHFVSSYKTELPVIIIDFDDTNSDIHGCQQLSLYNDYYGKYCYMALQIYEGLTDKLISTKLKPNRRSKGDNIYGIFKLPG